MCRIPFYIFENKATTSVQSFKCLTPSNMLQVLECLSNLQQQSSKNNDDAMDSLNSCSPRNES